MLISKENSHYPHLCPRPILRLLYLCNQHLFLFTFSAPKTGPAIAVRYYVIYTNRNVLIRWLSALKNKLLSDRVTRLCNPLSTSSTHHKLKSYAGRYYVASCHMPRRCVLSSHPSQILQTLERAGTPFMKYINCRIRRYWSKYRYNIILELVGYKILKILFLKQFYLLLIYLSGMYKKR